MDNHDCSVVVWRMFWHANIRPLYSDLNWKESVWRTSCFLSLWVSDDKSPLTWWERPVASWSTSSAPPCHSQSRIVFLCLSQTLAPHTIPRSSKHNNPHPLRCHPPIPGLLDRGDVWLLTPHAVEIHQHLMVTVARPPGAQSPGANDFSQWGQCCLSVFVFVMWGSWRQEELNLEVLRGEGERINLGASFPPDFGLKSTFVQTVLSKDIFHFLNMAVHYTMQFL